VSSQLYSETRNVFRQILRDAIDKWKKGICPSSKRRKTSERIKYSLSEDDDVVCLDSWLSENFSVHIRGLVNRYLETEEYLGKLLDSMGTELAEIDDSRNAFIEFFSRQMGFLLALSPVSRWDALMKDEIYVVKETPRLSLSFFDLAESIMMQYILLRSAAAHIYLYGSSKFRVEAIKAKTEMNAIGEDFDRFHSDGPITKKVAPAIYAFLSALNLVSSAVDRQMAKYPILNKLSISGGLRSKPIILTGMGAALAKALIHGVATRSETYVTNFFASALVGNRLLVEMWRFVEREKSIRSIVMEALTRYVRIKAQVVEKLKQAPKLYLRSAELYYDSSDAIRDSILIYLIQNVEEDLDEKQLSDLLRILI